MSATKKRGLPPNRRMRHDRHFVDEITQRMGEGIGRMLPVEQIASNEDQPRSSLGDMDDLVASIGKHGVLEPLLVRRKRNGEEGPAGATRIMYELVSGERRLHAALEAGLREVPCIELSVADDEALEIALVENLQRKDLSAFEEAEGFRTLVEKYGYTHEQVAEAVGRSRVTVTETLKLLEIPDDIRQLCRHADINAKGMLLEIAKAGSLEAMHNLVAEIIDDRLDRSALRQRRQEMSAEGEEAEAEADFDEQQPSPASGAARPRPFVVRFKNPQRNLTVALSFRTEREPETSEVIAALQELIRQLREEATEAGSENASED